MGNILFVDFSVKMLKNGIKSDSLLMHPLLLNSEEYCQHEQVLLNQLLYAEGLSQSWAEIVMPLVHQISANVHPDSTNDAEEMDIRQYISLLF